MEISMNQKIGTALNTLRPNAEWVLNGDDFSGLKWLDSKQTAPTWTEVSAEINNPTPKAEPTIVEKLASVGLNIDDLKAALGL